MLFFPSTFCGLILASKNFIQRMAFMLPTHIQLLAGYREVSASHRAALCYIEVDASKILAQTEVYYIKYMQASESIL